MITTHIGYGSPRQDTREAHGEPLGNENTLATKTNLGWPLNPQFCIPDEALKHFREAMLRGDLQESEWRDLFESYRRQYPGLAHELGMAIEGKLPSDWDSELPSFEAGEGPIATREASGMILNELARKTTTLLGGAGDLWPSTKTYIEAGGEFSSENPQGRNMHFGVREHAMGAILNGMAMHGGLIPYGGTFLVFSDYMRPSIRIASLMKAHVIYVFTHDSIGIGEDGPTHQPIEHLMSLRAMPVITVIRPADANETAIAWRLAITRKGPIALVLTRQKLPILPSARYPIAEGVIRGAYILDDPTGASPEIILIATGSEVHLILAAKKELSNYSVHARAVSMPSWEIFDEQPLEYMTGVLPPEIPKLAVEAGVTLGWHKYVGENGAVIGLNRFGASAPGNATMRHLGLTVENVVQEALRLLGKRLPRARDSTVEEKSIDC
jgi:transketolase